MSEKPTASVPPPSPTRRALEQAVNGLHDMAGYFRMDPVPPVLRELGHYSWDKLRRDAQAALMVAIVTIPQAIGFAVLVGIPVPAVIATAVVGGFFCALFSSSRHLVFGPTNTISIILAGALLTVAAVPLPSLQKVLVIGFMVGVFQVAAGLFKLGGITHFISRTVIVAYASAVGVLIAVGQVGNLLGLAPAEDLRLPGVVRHLATELAHFDLNPMTAGVGVSAFLLMVLLRRVRPRWPEGLIVVALYGALSVLYDWHAFGVPVVGDAGEVAGGMPLFVGFPTNEAGLRLIPQLASVALAAAILGMLEAVSITKTLAAKSGQHVNPNQELLAMGLGNLGATAFGAMPGSASFARSAACLESGGRTQVAGLLSSGFVLAIVLLLSPLLQHIPIAVLAAFLIRIAWRLLNWAHIHLVRRATRSDAVVFWGTLIAALTLQLDTAVYVGIGLSLALFLKKAGAPALAEYAFTDQGDLRQLAERPERRPEAISIVHVEGELFFGAADLFQEQVRYLADDEAIRVVILRMKNARHLDATAVMSLLQLHDYLRRSHRHLLVSGINPDVERVLQASGALRQLGEENVFRAEANLTMSTRRALLRARELLRAEGGSGQAEIRLFYDESRSRRDSAPLPAPASDYQI
jgi:SulP family sulfate permease